MEACEIPEEVGNRKAGVGVEMTAARGCFLTQESLWGCRSALQCHIQHPLARAGSATTG